MPEPCTKAATIDRIDRELFGNGKDGLIKEFTALKNEVATMNEHMDKMATSLSALAKSQIEQDAISKQRLLDKKERTAMIGRLGTIVAIVAGLIGLAYLIIDHLA